MDQTVNTAFNLGKYKHKITLVYSGSRIWCKFPYDKKLMAEIKSMQGAKWHGYEEPPKKMWSIANSQRNAFQIAFLTGDNPYAPFETPFDDKYNSTQGRRLYSHQRESINGGLTRPAMIWAEEMGTGKTLSSIELAESFLDAKDILWYVGPRSGVYAVRREFDKWQATKKPHRYLTYEKLTKLIKLVGVDVEVPRMVIFDESSKIKNPTSQRSEAARDLANLMREKYGTDLKTGCKVILMSGTPAPKSPADWFSQLEIACPGFIREGDIHKFKQRLCLIEQKESPAGGTFPQVITWLDDQQKCKRCGQLASHPLHTSEYDFEAGSQGASHKWEPSVNEVAYLYQRMQGLVLVKFKKDCLDLPEKRYEIIKVPSTPSIIRAAKLIKAQSIRAIQALTLLRELSDGFQYTSVETGRAICPLCDGKCVIIDKVPKDGNLDMTTVNVDQIEYIDAEIPCHQCSGKGDVPVYEQDTMHVESPKDQVIEDQLDLHEDVGRLIIWAGFTGSIDKLVAMARQQAWAVLRVDGRGFFATTHDGQPFDTDMALTAFDATHPDNARLKGLIPKLVFIGHPQAGGMALTLTSSPTEIFYSNSFQGEARMQAEDRFHRPGADENRGCTIIDIIHLSTDQLVLDNLKKKRKMQDITMGELAESIEQLENKGSTNEYRVDQNQ